MSILKKGRFTDWIGSCRRVAGAHLNSLGEKVPNFADFFVHGFSGHGWRLWNNGKGYQLEIDELTVRRQMHIYELLIEKIRALKGALSITQASGRVRSVEEVAVQGLDEWDSPVEVECYKLMFDDEQTGFVENDFVRCQNFTEGESYYRYYYVPIYKTASDGSVLLRKEDFDGMSMPEAGDELVQFGNRTNGSRQSAIYLSAMDGRPVIQVLMGLDSMDWSGKVKLSIGGIGEGEDAFGFFCENGKIVAKDKSGQTIYAFNPDGSGQIAGGRIWWDNGGSLHFKDGAITWDSLDDQSRENLKGEKGEPGKDANLLPWVEDWNGHTTQIDGNKVVSPNMFSGEREQDGTLTGVAVGRDAWNGKTGIFGIVKNAVRFALDPINGLFEFRGKVSADTMTFPWVELLKSDIKSDKTVKYIDLPIPQQCNFACSVIAQIDPEELAYSNIIELRLPNMANADSVEVCFYIAGRWKPKQNIYVCAEGEAEIHNTFLRDKDGNIDTQNNTGSNRRVLMPRRALLRFRSVPDGWYCMNPYDALYGGENGGYTPRPPMDEEKQ